MLYPTLKELFVLFHLVFTLISSQAIIVFLHSLFRSAVIQTHLMSELIGLMAQLRGFLFISAEFFIVACTSTVFTVFMNFAITH